MDPNRWDLTDGWSLNAEITDTEQETPDAIPSCSTTSTNGTESHDEVDDDNIRFELPANHKNRPETHGYTFWLKVVIVRLDEESCRIDVQLRHAPVPDCGLYHLLVDYQIKVVDCATDKTVALLCADHELLQADTSAQDKYPIILSVDSIKLDALGDFKCVLCLRVRQLLSPDITPITEEKGARDFAVLIAGRELYVNTTFLADLGGDEFAKWAKLKSEGKKRVALWDWNADQLQKYLQSLSTYRSVIVTCRNYEFMLEVSGRLQVMKALRECERFLCETSCMHDVRKLELACEHGLGILGDQVMRQLLQHPMGALQALHEYARIQRTDISDLHPDVLEALNVFESHVVL